MPHEFRNRPESYQGDGTGGRVVSGHGPCIGRLRSSNGARRLHSRSASAAKDRSPVEELALVEAADVSLCAARQHEHTRYPRKVGLP